MFPFPGSGHGSSRLSWGFFSTTLSSSPLGMLRPFSRPGDLHIAPRASSGVHRRIFLQLGDLHRWATWWNGFTCPNLLRWLVINLFTIQKISSLWMSLTLFFKPSQPWTVWQFISPISLIRSLPTVHSMTEMLTERKQELYLVPQLLHLCYNACTPPPPVHFMLYFAVARVIQK